MTIILSAVAKLFKMFFHAGVVIHVPNLRLKEALSRTLLSQVSCFVGGIFIIFLRNIRSDVSVVAWSALVVTNSGL